MCFVWLGSRSTANCSSITIRVLPTAIITKVIITTWTGWTKMSQSRMRKKGKKRVKAEKKKKQTKFLVVLCCIVWIAIKNKIIQKNRVNCKRKNQEETINDFIAITNTYTPHQVSTLFCKTTSIKNVIFFFFDGLSSITSQVPPRTHRNYCFVIGDIHYLLFVVDFGLWHWTILASSERTFFFKNRFSILKNPNNILF